MLCEPYTITIQSTDIDIYPGRIESVIKGFLHQRKQRFGQTLGTQCMCNALYLVAYLTIRKVRHFTTWDMDYILIAGNSLYSTLGPRSQLLSDDKLLV